VVRPCRADQRQVQSRWAKNSSVPLAGQALVSNDDVRRRAVGGWSLSICRALVASPDSFGLAEAESGHRPSQVQISISLDPQYQREWLGSSHIRPSHTGPSGGR